MSYYKIINADLWCSFSDAFLSYSDDLHVSKRARCLDSGT